MLRFSELENVGAADLGVDVKRKVTRWRTKVMAHEAKLRDFNDPESANVLAELREQLEALTASPAGDA